MIPKLPPKSAFTTPFVVEHDPILQGSGFAPSANVQITSLLRTSGLLHDIPSDELKSLLFLLTFVSANGNIQPSVYELADAMQVSEATALGRAHRLVHWQWRGSPVALETVTDTGIRFFTVAPYLISNSHKPMPQAQTRENTIVGVGREAVIAYSRARYARPRADVERDIAENMGWELPETASTPEAILKRNLIQWGVSRTIAEDLLTRHTIEEIQNQIDWLPYRNAKMPARYLVAAVEGSYSPPQGVRLPEVAPPATEDDDDISLPIP